MTLNICVQSNIYYFAYGYRYGNGDDLKVVVSSNERKLSYEIEQSTSAFGRQSSVCATALVM